MNSTNAGRLKIGLIGTGYWADQCHASGIEQSDDVDFVGVWGRDPEKTGEFAARHNTEPFSSPEALFAAADVISLAVPPSVQPELAVTAADAGCHLLLEKPIATSVGEAARIVDACDRNGVKSVVNFSALFGGSTGPWMRDVVVPVSWDGGSVTLLSDLRVTDTPFSGSPWRLLDNGSLWDVGPHALSLLVAGLGPVVDVKAQHGRGDTFVLALRHERGAVSNVILSYSVGVGGSRFEVEFWGPTGSIDAPPAAADSSPADSIIPALAALVESVRTDRPSTYGARFGAEIVDVLARAEGAAQIQGVTK
jgi:predicted dehydrogenase